MTTLTDVVAAVVVHSSAAAFSHFGVALDAPPAPPPAHVAAAPATAEQRVVARSRVRLNPLERASACPDAPKAHVIKA